jgi:hypothetical protein
MRVSVSTVFNNQSRSPRQNSNRSPQASVCVRIVFMLALLVWLLSSQAVSAQTAVPQPFPRPNQPARPAQPAPATPTAPAGAQTKNTSETEPPPTELILGVPVYPGAQFIRSYDAGRGQRYYIFGTAGSFVDLVAYYRSVLKQRGELVYEAPATHEFDVGKYNEEAMAFPPGVTIKDYQSATSQGYPNPKPGGQPARFPTLIQIVPVR